MSKFAATLVLAVTLASCAGGRSNEPLNPDVARMQDQGYDKRYIEGYDDGCHSGRAAAGNLNEHITKDTDQYEDRDQYRQGWEDGYRICEGREKAFYRRVQASDD